MSRPDALATAALAARVIKPVWFAWLDILGDPVRTNTSGADITFTGNPDPELNATFLGLSGDLISISDVSVAEGGTGTVAAALSGLPSIDADTLNTIGNTANWQGRTARLWRMIRNAADEQQGALQPYYTGYMTALDIGGSPESQRITVTIENYLAAFSAASNRTYLDQARYDPGDLSAQAAPGIVNGTAGALAGASGAPSGGGSGLGGGSRMLEQNKVALF